MEILTMARASKRWSYREGSIKMMIKLRDIGESEPYCEKVARDALTMSTDMLDMFVKKDMLACVGLVLRMKRSSYQDSPWHLVQECCQQSCCPTTTAFQWITRWNVPSPAFLHSCFLAFMHLVRQYHNTTIFKYNSCSILHLVKEKKTNGRLELKRSTGNNQSNKHCARPHLRLAVPPNSHWLDRGQACT